MTMKLLFLYFVSAFSKINLAVTSADTTPVIYWSGTQTWATLQKDGRECWNNTQMADVIRNGEPPVEKKKLLDEHGCRMDFGLECVKVTDNSANFKHGCRCMLNLGSKPAILNPANPNSDDTDTKFGSKAQCYIPAGNGHASQCFHTNSKDKLLPSENVGFPYAFGDPGGIGPDPPKLTDTFGSGTNLDTSVTYVPWNSIRGRCAPNADCVDGSTYLDKRCQCVKSTTLIRSTGLCKGHANQIMAFDSDSMFLLPLCIVLIFLNQ